MGISYLEWLPASCSFFKIGVVQGFISWFYPELEKVHDHTFTAWS